MIQSTERVSTAREIEMWFAFVNQICEFAYLCGHEFARVGGCKEDVPFLVEPQAVLAWEAGWDDFQKRTS